MTKSGRKKENSIILDLASIFEKSNRKKNFILIITVALSITSLFFLISIVNGRIHADNIKAVRENGTVASVILENASKKQLQEISELNYVNETGLLKNFGLWYKDKKEISICSLIGEDDFDKMYLPAYENMVGNYPQSANEIMLPIRTLHSLGIEKPELGMEIPVYIVPYNWIKTGIKEIDMKFRLSGYYTDYVSSMEKLPSAYFSEKLAKEKKIDFFLNNVLIKSNELWMNKSQLEKTFYRDISLENNQKFQIIYEGASQTLRNMLGSCGFAFAGILIILFSMNLFIYHIFSLSINKDRKQYGLLRVIGATPRQIKMVFLIQSIKILIAGTVMGAVLGSLSVILILPGLIEKMFLAGNGSLNQMDLFTWKLLVISILLTLFGELAAFKRSISAVTKLSPVECLNYEEKITVPKRKYESQSGVTIMGMAWRNFTRNKVKMQLTVCSLFVGIEIFLLSVFITNGLDQTNRIKQEPDFEIGVTKECVEYYLLQNDGRELKDLQGHHLVSEELINEISRMAEIKKNDIVKCMGSFGTFNRNSKAMVPRIHSYQYDTDIITDLTVQVVSDKWINDLKEYIKNRGYTTNIEDFRNENSFILLHNHELSEQQLEEAEKAAGEKLTGVIFEEQGKNFEMVCSGYLDLTEKGFPKLNMPWDGRNLNYIIISKKTMETLDLNPIVYNITFNVKEENDAKTKNIVQGILTDASQNSEFKNTYYMKTNSDILAKEQGYLFATRIIMGAFSGILIIFALINYGSMIVAEHISRRMEFAIMQSIGITKKQLKKMMIWEVLFYCIVTFGLLLTAGSGIILIIGEAIKSQSSYFVFQYPGSSFFVSLILLLLISILIQSLLHSNRNKVSVIEELRNINR